MKRSSSALAAAGGLAVALLLAGCAPGAQPSPTTTATHTPKPTPSMSATSTPVATPTPGPSGTAGPTTTPAPSSLDSEHAWNACASTLKTQYGISPLGSYSPSDVIANGKGYDVAISFDPSTGQGRQSPFVCTITGTNAAPVVQETTFGK